jgi:glutamine amidotransferase
MNRGRIVVVDYGMGNLSSVERQLARLRANVLVTSDPATIVGADKLVIPGVGHFASAMRNLQRMRLVEPLSEAVLGRRRPVLGICLGLHLMTNTSEEGGGPGLGWIDAEVVRFGVPDPLLTKVPHMGWNRVEELRPSVVTKGVAENAEVYFAHSFHLKGAKEGIAVQTTSYAYRFVAAIAQDHIFGVQYHPERSHEAGATILKNFIAL